MEKCWGNCPSEIISIIFKKLDITTLISCMHVSKKWKDIAHYVAETCGLWQKIVEQTIMDNGVSYRSKSKLEWNEIYDNNMLWHVIEKAKTLIIILNIGHSIVTNFHVYKDNLIVVYDDKVKYFNIGTLKQTKEIDLKCDGYEESDHMIIESTNSEDGLQVNIYSKQEPNGLPKLEKFSNLKYVLMYKLQDDRCCLIGFFDKIYIISWCAEKRKLVLKCLGYSLIVKTLHMYRSKLYVLLKTGAVLEYDMREFTQTPEKIFMFHIQSEIVENPIVMFNKYNAVIGVSPVNEFSVKRDIVSDVMLLKCPALSCAMEHGDVLLLGYMDGRIQVILPDKFSKSGEPELELHVQTMDPSIDQPEILKLDVYEVNYAHYLVIGTRYRVLLVLMKYPESTAYYHDFLNN